MTIKDLVNSTREERLTNLYKELETARDAGRPEGILNMSTTIEHEGDTYVEVNKTTKYYKRQAQIAIQALQKIQTIALSYYGGSDWENIRDTAKYALKEIRNLT